MSNNTWKDFQNMSREQIGYANNVDIQAIVNQHQYHNIAPPHNVLTCQECSFFEEKID